MDRPHRILVAEDDDGSRRVFDAAVVSMYNVTTAHDGMEALRVARRDPPALIISDLMMPRMDGGALLQALKRDPKTAAIPVIIMSAKADMMIARRDWTRVRRTTLRSH